VSAPPYDFASGDLPRRGHFTAESTDQTDWSRTREKQRKRLLHQSEGFSKQLAKWAVDDTATATRNDSFLWGELRDWRVKDTSEYWNALCNGTNMSVNNSLPGDVGTGKLDIKMVNAKLAKWPVQNDSTCPDYVNDKNYTDALEAFKECGSACSGIADVGSNRKAMRLCKTGGVAKQANGTTFIKKPLNFVPPEGMPRPPIELKFWSDFCKYRMKGRQIRIMFEGKNCADAVVKTLSSNASNPVECADEAAKDANCSAVYDFRFGPPTVCRCLKKDKECAPAVATGGNVFAPSLSE